MTNGTKRLGTWAKGQSGNPAGRPALPAEFREQIRSHTAAAIGVLVDALKDPDARVRVATTEAYGVQWSEDVGRLLDHLAIDRAHIVGYSMGGLVTLKFAVDHPDRMLSGTLVGMGLLPQGGARQQGWARRHGPAASSVADLALTPEQVKAVILPFRVLIGSNDPGRAIYIESLLSVRPPLQKPTNFIGPLGATANGAFLERGQEGEVILRDCARHEPPGRPRSSTSTYGIGSSFSRHPPDDRL